jgi:integrase
MARQNKPWFRASKGTWYATVKGRKVSLGVQGEENVKDAHAAWHRFMAGIERENKRAAKELTTREVIWQFLADCEGRVKPNTLRVYRLLLLPFCKKYGSTTASDLTAMQAEAFSRCRGWSDTTRNAFLGAVVTAFRWAVKSRLIAEMPLTGLERPPKSSRGVEALVTPEEHGRLMEKATPAFALFLRILYATGARPGEVAAITAENFDTNLGMILLRKHKTAHKGKCRTVHLTPEITALLFELTRRSPTGPLLRNTRGEPWSGKALVKAMIAARRRAGIGRAICYGYRHTFATDALANGVPDAQVAELLGHSGTAMLHKHYSHLTARTQVLQAALGRVRP